MNVLMVFPFVTGKGGMETVIAHILKNVDSTNNFHLLLPGGSEDENWLDGLSNKVTCHHKKSMFAIFYDTVDFIIKNRPDVVISMSKIQIIAAWIAKKVFRRQFYLISWNHFSLGETRFSYLLRVFRLCDYHLAISSGIQRQLVQAGVPKQKISLIFNPVEASAQLIPRSKGIRKEFVYIGRIQSHGQKNLSELMNILEGVKHYDWHLRVIGAGPDTDELKSQSALLKIDERITWMGWQSNPWKCIERADLLFLTSKFEGFPMILAEAMAHGVPCFSSNCPTGPEDIINDGNNGSLYDLGNIDQAKNILISNLEGRLCYAEPVEIQRSISNLYSENYFQKLDHVLCMLGKDD